MIARAAVIFALALPRGVAAGGEPEQLNGKVVSVTDGDTVRVFDATGCPHYVRDTFAVCR